MIYEPATARHLKPWLVKTLEPICDAEPGALADYILALLKHNVPENDMKKELSSQLEEFLEREGPAFIDTLFTVLRTKSYLPYASSSSPTSYPPSSPRHPDAGIPIPLDGLLSQALPTPPERGQKRNLEHDERDGRPPTKGPRLSSDSQFSRYPNGRGQGFNKFGNGGRGDRHGMGPSSSTEGSQQLNNMNGRWQQSYQPPDQRKGICRDYYNNGYCARGALCKYSHGDDAVVPSQLFPMNGAPVPGAPIPFMPMFPGVMPFGMTGQNAPYDPHQARMDMRPPPTGPGGRGQRPPLLSKDDATKDSHAIHTSGELPVIQDLTPRALQDPPSSIGVMQEMNMQKPAHKSSLGEVAGPSSEINDVIMAGPEAAPPSSRGGMRGSLRGGRGRGVFPGDAHSFRPERRNDKTLVVEKIPDDKLTLENVNNWFKRFGTVTNVAIDATSAKALVSFSSHDEAHAAWKSEDAVFNNRFVKLFWHRPLEGHGQTGARMLAASAPVVAHLSSKGPEIPAAVLPPAATIPKPPQKATVPSAAVSALAAKQKLLEQQITEQKALMTSLQTASPEEKKQIMARLRQLGEEMNSSSSLSAPTASPARPSHQRSNSTSTPLNDEQRKERERLDKELELHAATVENGSESTDSLKAELERLKAEAARLGVPGVAPESAHSSPYRPYRGRGRGRGHFYPAPMRGGPLRASMKLDNRPKKLFISSLGENDVQAVRDLYQSTNQLGSIETVDGGGLVVAFKSRLAAEQALAKGQEVPSIGRVQITWHTGQPSKAISSSTPSQEKDHDVSQETSSSSPEASYSHAQEEEVASGWGTVGDEDGMGML